MLSFEIRGTVLVDQLSTAHLQELRALIDAELARREQPAADLRDERARDTVRAPGEERSLNEHIDRL